MKWIKVSEYFFLLKLKNIVFVLHKAMEKPHLDLHFKYHDVFPWNNEDMKILNLRFFYFGTQISLLKFLFKSMSKKNMF